MDLEVFRRFSRPRRVKQIQAEKKEYIHRRIIAQTVQNCVQTENPIRPGPKDTNNSKTSGLKRSKSIQKLYESTSSTLSTITISGNKNTTVKGKRYGSETQRAYEAHATKLRNEISNFFGTATGKPVPLKPISPNSEYFDPLQATVDPYLLEIITQELENEELNYRISSTKELENQFSKRTEIVKWIKKVGNALKVLSQTLHLAIYIVDSFLRVQTVPIYSLELFAAAVLFIAAKQEETDCMLTSVDLLNNCSSGLNFTPRRLTCMESRVLMKLQFKICCPTAQFFMEACASQLSYCDSYAKIFCTQLAEKLLLNSLWELEMIFVPNSKKARLALHYAAKYISYNYDLLRSSHGKDKVLWEKFIIKCYPEFRTAALQGVRVPKRISIDSPQLKRASILREATNKRYRKTTSQPGVVSTVVTRSRARLCQVMGKRNS